MTLPKPYQYRKIPRRPEKMRANRQPRVTENEVLTGVVQGSEASDIEERFAKALYKNKLDFDFQARFPEDNPRGILLMFERQSDR